MLERKQQFYLEFSKIYNILFLSEDSRNVYVMEFLVW